MLISKKNPSSVYTTGITLCLILLINTNPVFAQGNTINFNDMDIDGEAIPRVMLSSAIDHIINKEGNIALLFTESSIVVQLTNEGLDEITNQIRQKEEGESGSLLGDLFRSVLSTSLYTLFDHGIALPLSKIKHAEYTDGQLRIYTIDDEVLFEDFNINDNNLIDDFDQAAGRRFARSLNKYLN